MLLITYRNIVASIGAAAPKGQGNALKDRDPGLPFAGHAWRLWTVREDGPSFQISMASAIARASSSSTPRYRTVLSILVCPSRSWTARKLPVFL